jgi:hypothetical protein
METVAISGANAVRRMRLCSRGQNVHFGLMHLTYDRSSNTTGGLRKVERARLRPALPKELFAVNGDHYLPYTDLDTGEKKMAWKKLIRKVAFPPHYQFISVCWFNPHCSL